MIRKIGRMLYFCCPQCGQRLHKITAKAECHGVTTFCKRCKWEGLMEIKTEKEA